jgi:putative flavoprotein involved in K+ transport
VIWATGFTGDFSWIHLPIFDDQNKLIHERGVAPERGLYFVGFPWLNSRKSGIIYGVNEDANFIANAIREQLASLHGS